MLHLKYCWQVLGCIAANEEQSLELHQRWRMMCLSRVDLMPNHRWQG
jgi:hypothetical protein